MTVQIEYAVHRGSLIVDARALCASVCTMCLDVLKVTNGRSKHKTK